jgi:hypothetical protein
VLLQGDFKGYMRVALMIFRVISVSFQGGFSVILGFFWRNFEVGIGVIFGVF